ncbi:tetratricopeptide repeat protein [Candidatus Pandoraea novymonadis]|uniref:Ancillary SecYEG translocon subunit/Cell division coordinator CpoB TPR domain-containing protein n=1 Tax=Candidatus Pandoraea novymonadis TaxID=1808959 RepID=A0ABX5FEP9_9BURK|nr:tetratricopeptide repeat protein [Candidatus Pandoraea novymonadis]PSB91933.1 hypothetical protein BZL35_00153 [Candidatus Pandoraea novymonadis]
MDNHQEDQQIQKIKAWYARCGKNIIWIFILIILAFVGWNLSRYLEHKQVVKARVLYGALNKAVDQNDKKQVARIVLDMEDKFRNIAYAKMTALLAAKILDGSGDSVASKKHLQWVIEGSKDNEYRQLAKLRLAGLLLDQKEYEEGLKVLSSVPSPSFIGLFEDRRGDLLAAQDKIEAARIAYKLSLEKLDTKEVSLREFIQFKLDALGG